MSYRAEKSGFARDAEEKIKAKYDPGLAQQCMEWIARQVTDESVTVTGDHDKVHEQLKDGHLLCKLMNNIRPGSVTPKSCSPSKMAFKQMEAIGIFVEAMRKEGISDNELFQTVDLYEPANLSQVIISLAALARKLGTFGPKEAEKNERVFTEEQRKAGQGIIGLQMGTNKGASQAGMNIGKTRHIID